MRRFAYIYYKFQLLKLGLILEDVANNALTRFIGDKIVKKLSKFVVVKDWAAKIEPIHSFMDYRMVCKPFNEKTEENIEKFFKRIESDLAVKYNLTIETVINKKGAISFGLKTLKVKRAVPPQFIYHCTSKTSREAISKEGLEPKSGSIVDDTKIKWGYGLNYPDAIFFSTDPKNLWHVCEDVWEVDTYKLGKRNWYSDLNIGNYKPFIMTFEKIDPAAIRLLSREEVFKLKTKR